MIDAQTLVQKLQTVLGLSIRTGQITLTLRNGELETFETRTYGRLRPKHAAKGLDEPNAIPHTVS